MAADLIVGRGAGIAYAQPLVDGVFLGRRKRFFADVRLEDGQEVVAHCANTGSMWGVSTPGSRCRVLDVRGRGRKLDWSLEQIEADGAWTMIHTGRPNRIVEEALRAGWGSGCAAGAEIERERPYGDGHRIDLRIPGEPEHLIEVKNVTWVEGGIARFPDAVSVRARQHLAALAQAVARGAKATVVLHVARGDARVAAPADDKDPAFGEALRAALAAGVEVVAWDVEVTREGVAVRSVLPVWPSLAEAERRMGV